MVSKDDIQSMDPYEFELLVAKLWEARGYNTETSPKSADMGIDIHAEKGGMIEKIQVKRYTGDNKINSKHVRDYATLYGQTNANRVTLVTSGDTTDPAEELADELQVDLTDGSDLTELIEQYSIDISNYSNSPTGNTAADTEGTTQDSITPDRISVSDGEYVIAAVSDDRLVAEVAEMVRDSLGPASQFDDNTKVGEALISGDEMRVLTKQGQRILDARVQQADEQERAPDVNLDRPATADVVESVFPKLPSGLGGVIAPNFDTIRDMVEAPLGDYEDIYGVAEGTIGMITDGNVGSRSESLISQRDRPLGIEEAAPSDAPVPDVELGKEPDVSDGQAGTAGEEPVTRVNIPDNAPEGERWIGERIREGNRVQPNSYTDNSIIEIIFPTRISEEVEKVVAANDISRGGKNDPLVQSPSFTDDIPRAAAHLSGIQFMLSDPSHPRSSGFDIRDIVSQLSQRPVIMTQSSTVQVSLQFRE